MPTTLLLIRHGIAEDLRSDMNEGGLPTPSGLTDADRALTAEGWTKTRAAMRGLVALGYAPTRGLTSPFRRARETLDCLREAAGRAFPIEAWPVLVPHGDPGVADLQLRALMAELSEDEVVALTSHQPFLGDLIFRLAKRGVEVKKASCTVLHWREGAWSFERHLAPADLRERA